MANRPAPIRKRRPWWTLPAISFLILVTGNALLWTWAEHRRATNEEHIFLERSALLVHEMNEVMENNADALRALRGYIQSEGTPSSTGWHAFLDSLSAKDRYPGILSFQYSQRVDAMAVQAFDRQAKETGRPPIWDLQGGRSASPRAADSYFPVLLSEPPDPAILSFDISSREDIHRTAQSLAADSGHPALGPPFHLLQAPQAWVVPLMAPIYVGTPHPASMEERRSLLRGFVTLLMDPKEVFAGLGDGELLDCAIYDGDRESAESLIFSRGSYGEASSRLMHREKLKILGRTWSVEVRGKQWWNRLGRRDSWQVVGSGIAVSLGLLAAIISLALTRERAIALAERMTRELREANRALLDLATTDSLTGLLNRRAMDGRKFEEGARAARDGTPLSVISMDLDFFKHGNDKYGHAMGDTVLRNLGRMLRDSVRLTDHAGRVGGEEFLLVCPNTDAQGALVLAEQLRSRFETMDHTEGLVRIRVTASFGVATEEPGAEHEMNRLLRRADRALYRAKEMGRNRVEVWTPRSVPPQEI